MARLAEIQPLFLKTGNQVDIGDLKEYTSSSGPDRGILEPQFKAKISALTGDIAVDTVEKIEEKIVSLAKGHIDRGKFEKIRRGIAISVYTYFQGTTPSLLESVAEVDMWTVFQNIPEALVGVESELVALAYPGDQQRIMVDLAKKKIARYRLYEANPTQAAALDNRESNSTIGKIESAHQKKLIAEDDYQRAIYFLGKPTALSSQEGRAQRAAESQRKIAHSQALERLVGALFRRERTGPIDPTMLASTRPGWFEGNEREWTGFVEGILSTYELINQWVTLPGDKQETLADGLKFLGLKDANFGFGTKDVTGNPLISNETMNRLFANKDFGQTFIKIYNELFSFDNRLGTHVFKQRPDGTYIEKVKLFCESPGRFRDFLVGSLVSSGKNETYAQMLVGGAMALFEGTGQMEMSDVLGEYRLANKAVRFAVNPDLVIRRNVYDETEKSIIPGEINMFLDLNIDDHGDMVPGTATEEQKRSLLLTKKLKMYDLLTQDMGLIPKSMFAKGILDNCFLSPGVSLGEAMKNGSKIVFAEDNTKDALSKVRSHLRSAARLAMYVTSGKPLNLDTTKDLNDQVNTWATDLNSAIDALITAGYAVSPGYVCAALASSAGLEDYYHTYKTPGDGVFLELSSTKPIDYANTARAIVNGLKINREMINHVVSVFNISMPGARMLASLDTDKDFLQNHAPIRHQKVDTRNWLDRFLSKAVPPGSGKLEMPRLNPRR